MGCISNREQDKQNIHINQKEIIGAEYDTSTGYIDEAAPPQPMLSDAMITMSEAMSVKDEHKAKAIIEEALHCIYGDNNLEITDDIKQDIDSALAMIHSINPQDEVEKLKTAMVVLSNILGVHKLSQPDQQDQQTALRLLKASNSVRRDIYRNRVT